MHEFDAATQQLAETVLVLLRELAALDPTPLNGTIAPSEVPVLASKLINAAGNDPNTVLELFTSVLGPSVIRADSPRFLAWIPSAPTKASMLFDAVVSLASISGVSWIESAGAVWAENEALRFIADLAGMPASAGGTFVQGGSAANLSALAVARDSGRRRLGDARRRLQFAITPDTHSSVRNTMHLLDVDPILVPLVDDRLTGDALAATLDACADPSLVCAVVANAGSTNAGLVDDLAGVARICADRNLWMHVDAAYGGGALLAPSTRAAFAGIEHSDSLVVDPHKWLYAPARLRGVALSRSGARPHGARAARGVPRLDERRHGRLEPLRLRLPTHAARPGPSLLVLARGARLRRVPRRGRAGARRRRAARPTASARSPTSSSCASPSCRSCCSGASDGTRTEYAAWSERLSHDQVALVVPTRWHDETVARLAFLHPGTTLEIVDEILATTS